jgi:hypothetical protein
MVEDVTNLDKGPIKNDQLCINDEMVNKWQVRIILIK